MITTFRTLFSLTVAHDFYSDGCRDFDFVISSGTAGLLRNGKLIAKVRDGKLHILYEADDNGIALNNLAGSRLQFGMKLLNPLFSNFTEFAIPTPLYRNTAAAGSLDPAMVVALTGRLLRHAITKTIRPVTIAISDPIGQLLKTETITSKNDCSTISFDLSGQTAGSYSVVESYSSETETATYYLDTELVQAGAFGVVEIMIDNSFYTLPASFMIDFRARRETLKYYVVATNYNSTDFDQLSVSDDGYAEEERPRIDFTRVLPADFTADEIQPEMLAKTGDRVVLFKSQALVARQEKARKKIQLSKHGDVLIKHLPQAGADRTSGDVVIHISKP